MGGSQVAHALIGLRVIAWQDTLWGVVTDDVDAPVQTPGRVGASGLCYPGPQVGEQGSVVVAGVYLEVTDETAAHLLTVVPVWEGDVGGQGFPPQGVVPRQTIVNSILPVTWLSPTELYLTFMFSSVVLFRFTKAPTLVVFSPQDNRATRFILIMKPEETTCLQRPLLGRISGDIW